MYKSLWNILNENLDKISNQIKKQGYAVMTNTNKSMGTSINLMGYLDGGLGHVFNWSCKLAAV